MEAKRRTMRQLNAEKHRVKLAEMAEDVADGTLTIRQMTPQEHAEADRNRAAVAVARAKRAATCRR